MKPAADANHVELVYTLAEGDRVTVRRAAFRARFLYPEGHDYFAMLREMLHWCAMPERIAGAGDD